MHSKSGIRFRFFNPSSGRTLTTDELKIMFEKTQVVYLLKGETAKTSQVHFCFHYISTLEHPNFKTVVSTIYILHVCSLHYLGQTHKFGRSNAQETFLLPSPLFQHFSCTGCTKKIETVFSPYRACHRPDLSSTAFSFVEWKVQGLIALLLFVTQKHKNVKQI